MNVLKFKNKNLERFYEGDTSKIEKKLHARINIILNALESANSKVDLNLPGLDLHEYKEEKHKYSIKVNKNWRILFTWTEGKEITKISLEDPH